VRGRLAVGLIPTVTAVDVPAGLQRFRKRYPQVRISLQVGASDDLTEQVRQGTLDVAFLGLPTTARLHGVAAHELARDRLVAVVAPDHPLADEPTVNLRRLSSEVFVDFPAGTAGRIQSDQAFAAAGLDRNVAFEVTTADYVDRLVGQNLGVAMLPAPYAPQLTGVVALQVADAPIRVQYIVWSESSRTPAATAFLAVLDIPAGTATGRPPGTVRG
jgi:DNA-binding transcriptional LysR family regulator